MTHLDDFMSPSVCNSVPLAAAIAFPSTKPPPEIRRSKCGRAGGGAAAEEEKKEEKVGDGELGGWLAVVEKRKKETLTPPGDELREIAGWCPRSASAPNERGIVQILGLLGSAGAGLVEIKMLSTQESACV